MKQQLGKAQLRGNLEAIFEISDSELDEMAKTAKKEVKQLLQNSHIAKVMTKFYDCNTSESKRFFTGPEIEEVINSALSGICNSVDDEALSDAISALKYSWEELKKKSWYGERDKGQQKILETLIDYQRKFSGAVLIQAVEIMTDADPKRSSEEYTFNRLLPSIVLALESKDTETQLRLLASFDNLDDIISPSLLNANGHDYTDRLATALRRIVQWAINCKEEMEQSKSDELTSETEEKSSKLEDSAKSALLFLAKMPGFREVYQQMFMTLHNLRAPNFGQGNEELTEAIAKIEKRLAESDWTPGK